MMAAHADAVFRYHLRRVPSTAEDLTQETFRIAWQKRSSIHQAPRLWLYATARRVLANHLRSARRQEQVVSALEPLSTGVTAGEFERVAVRDALARLSSRDREVLLLAFWEQLSPHEIASVLEIRPSAASKRLERAKQRFGSVWNPPVENGSLRTFISAGEPDQANHGVGRGSGTEETDEH